MTYLVACLGSKGPHWDYLRKLIDSEAWEAVFIVCGPDGNEFTSTKKLSFIFADSKLPLSELSRNIQQGLKDKIIDTEVAVNFVLGTGKEHMALISAVIKLGLGIRLVAYSNEGVVEI